MNSYNVYATSYVILLTKRYSIISTDLNDHRRSYQII